MSLMIRVRTQNFYNENKKQRYKSLTSLSVSVKRGGITDRYGVMLSKVGCIMECNAMIRRTNHINR